MAVVALIPTGSMEHMALAPALQQLFPSDTFVVRPAEQHLDGFTSCDVTHLNDSRRRPITNSLEELARELVNAIFPGRRGQKIDFAYVIEDLELCNQHQPEVVLMTFRKAVEDYIQSQWPQQAGDRMEAVREQCSFHLFRPMTEAYFFADPQSLARAGTRQAPCLSNNVDLELFRTNDAAYLMLPPKTRHVVEMPEREQHPKSYLQFLCDPTLASLKPPYRETHNGKSALQSLDWELILNHPSRCPFLTAFLDDLGQALNSPLPFVVPAHADSRVRVFESQDRVLRNL